MRGLIVVLVMAGWLGVADFGLAQTPPADRVKAARDVAGKVELKVEPAYRWRYEQNRGPSLLGGRRAFYPNEKLTLTFNTTSSLPPDQPVARISLALYDMEGRKRQEIGDMAIPAQPPAGVLSWTVPEVKEREYFFVARFLDADGKHLVTRSEVVFITPEYPGLRAEAQAAIKRAAERNAAAKSDVFGISFSSVEMMLEDAEIRWHDFGEMRRDWGYIREQLRLAKSYADQLAAGRDPYRTRTGAFVKAYRSEMDNTLQPYAVYVPRSYNPARSYPLLISLHGATSTHRINLRRVFGFGNRPGETDYEATRNEVELPDVDFIVASPYGRGEIAGYSGIGEADVLRVMADMQKAYNVDADRVYLTGLSMGGMGTWYIGLLHPDLFAAIVPVCGVADMSRRSASGPWADTSRQVADLTAAVNFAENAANLPVYIYHGDMDDVVPVEQSRRMAERYRELGWLGRSVQYYELPGVNHFAWDFSYRHGNIFKILAPIKRDPRPRRVVFTTFSPRYNKAYWLRIDQIDKGLQLARIEGERQGNLFSIKTDNVSAFSILLEPGLVPAGQEIEVQLDGKSIYRGRPNDKILSFAPGEDGQIRPHRWEGPTQGPPDHMGADFRSRALAQAAAHVYVYGTNASPEVVKASRELAETLANWGPGVKAAWRVLADTELTENDLKRYNLILVGNAGINRQVARIRDQLPIRDDGDGVQAGGQTVSGKDAAYRLNFYHPLAPGRYIQIYGAGTAAGLDHLRQIARTPGVQADYVLLDGEGTVKLAGLFKDRWRIGE
jgi:pimeloyl-ACP methyl ester carboxylesterase